MHRTKLSKTKRLLRYWDCKSHSKKFKFICSMTPSQHFSPCHYNKNWNRKCRWQVFKGNKRKKVSVESHWQLQSCELERRTIRINGCIWPSAIFLSRQRMDLSIFWSTSPSFAFDCIKLYGFILSFENQGQNIHLQLPYFGFWFIFLWH